jgi:hypothetical protein
MALQGPAAEWRLTCGWLKSRCPRHLAANLLVASAYLGLLAGLSLGALVGGVFAIGTSFGSYAPGLGGFALVAGSLVGAITGVTVGIVNGIVLTVLSHTPVLRSGSGLSRNRVTCATVVSTCLGSLALLYPLFRSSGGIFVYPPVIAASLLAIPASRKLRLS